ncbi:uncharacterized protein LOC126735034 [Anthonomus grandis grandis]|uniref:uncharacterized protein LOC126735034 n=1 Tax=Anthonomus grandis grandis TaxID=2921223 RepID=UPI002165399A|nr:uncharacterized protein LOC126735034 [Anthonomus grandis grandis]
MRSVRADTDVCAMQIRDYRGIVVIRQVFARKSLVSTVYNNSELLRKFNSACSSYKELYDLSDRYYSNHHRKDEIWREIAKKVGEISDVCKETWRKLRDNYRKAKQLRNTKSGQSAKKIKPKKIEKELAFLNPHLQQPQELQTSNLLVSSSGDDSDADGSSQQLTEGFSEPPTPDSAKSIASTSTCHLSRSKRKREHVQHSPMQEYLQFKREQQVSSQTNAHPLDVFFSSMAATVKTFPAPTQLNIKRQVFQLVTDAEATLTPPENAIPLCRPD